MDLYLEASLTEQAFIGHLRCTTTLQPVDHATRIGHLWKPSLAESSSSFLFAVITRYSQRFVLWVAIRLIYLPRKPHGSLLCFEMVL
jgi:hypothetical protein